MNTTNNTTHPKENALPDYKIWWNGLSQDEQYQLSCKHFVGIPINTLMDKSIEAMYQYEHPQPLKEDTEFKYGDKVLDLSGIEGTVIAFPFGKAGMTRVAFGKDGKSDWRDLKTSQLTKKEDIPNTGTVTGEGLHTKGEWITANKIGSGSSLRIYCTDNVQRTHIADCFSFSVGISDVEAEANANRIVNCVNGWDKLQEQLTFAMDSWHKENEMVAKLEADNERLRSALKELLSTNEMYLMGELPSMGSLHPCKLAQVQAKAALQNK